MHLKIKIKWRNIVLVLFLFSFFLYCIYHSRNYEIQYEINTISITERFDKKDKVYYFLFKNDENEFYSVFNHAYIADKKFVNAVELKQEGDTICIFPKSDKFAFMPLCRDQQKLISYHLIENDSIIPAEYKKEISYNAEDYDRLKLNYIKDYKYYIWNYTGFYVISDDIKKEIKLFDNDVYNIPLAIKNERYILLADYNEKYAFKKFLVLDTKTDKVHELELDNEIAFDSYFLGATKKKVYLIDRKNKIEYEIYPKKMNVKNITNKNQGRIFQNGTWEERSIQSLINEEIHFSNKENTKFIIEDNILYKVQSDYKTQLSFKNVKDIIYQKDDTVFYLVDDQLYYYNDSDGEILVMSNFEWNFNYKNMIYIF